jgi:hypothetical protein
MKKLAYLFLSLMLGCITAEAQNSLEKVSLTYGEELPDDKQKIVKLIGEANNKIYGLGTNGKDDFVLKIFESGNMKLITSKPIVIPEMNDKEVDFEDIFLLNGKLYAIGSVYHKKDKIFTLVASPLSEEGKLGKDGIVLFKAAVAKKSDRGAFYFKQTQDENGLLIMHTALFDKEDAVKYEVKLFDDNLNAVFTNIEKVTFDDHKKDYEFTIADFDVNYKDDVFLVINESYRDNKKKEKVERFEIHAFKSDKNYAKEIINIDLKDKEIINCSMLSTANNVVQLVGFYSSVRESGRANRELKGVYNATIDLATNTNTNLKFNEFDYATKVKLIGERRAKKGKDVKPLYNIHSIIEKNDGGLIILSEFQYVMYNRSAGIGPLALTQVTYIKNEIIVTSLKPDGSLEWSNVLPKEQVASTSTLSVVLGTMGTSGSFSVGMAVAIPFAQMGRGPEYLGCIPIYKNGELNIIINDNIKNKGITEIEDIKAMGNYNNAVPSLFIFDKTGKITRKDPEEAIKNELVLRPGVYYRKNQNEYIVYSSRKKKDKLGRMILQD